MVYLLRPYHFVCFIIHSGIGSWYPSASFVDTPTEISIKDGAHAFLPCRVANLGDRSVTWMRKKGLHIISAGMLTYSPDDRYKVLHPTNTDEWTLHIRFATKNDAGWYECQVNSDPKIMRQVFLIVKDRNVNDPFYEHDIDVNKNGEIVSVEGPKERFMQTGSILAITCTVDHNGGEGPDQIAWFHGGTLLDYDSPRGGIALQMEKTKTETVSKLMLSAVGSKDSGRYTCRPDTGGYASITVHVQTGQHQAAVQQSGHNASINDQFSIQIILILTSFIHLFLYLPAG